MEPTERAARVAEVRAIHQDPLRALTRGTPRLYSDLVLLTLAVLDELTAIRTALERERPGRRTKAADGA
jgi:hypothetical protein